MDPLREHPESVLRGDIFWVAADASRGSIPGHPHPHVVVQEDVFNRSRLTSVVVCALSKNAKLCNEPGNVLLQVGEGNLERASVVVASQLSCVMKDQLGPYIGSLSAQRVDEILAGLHLQETSFFRRSSASDT